MATRCGDTKCKFYNPNGCTAGDIDHTADRFCITGRRRERNFTKELMDHFNSGCVKQSGKFKSNHGTVLK